LRTLLRLPKLAAPKGPLDALESEAPLRGGVEVACGWCKPK